MGALFVDADLIDRPNSTLTTIYGRPGPRGQPNQQLVSEVLDITLVDGAGHSMTQLDSPLVICFPRLNGTKENKVCLSYYDEVKAKWICEDECLTTTSDGNLLCGQTGHLTNFALLLLGLSNSNGGADSPCESPSFDNTLSWISMGLVAGAIIIVASSVILVEGRIRYKEYRLNTVLNRVATNAANL